MSELPEELELDGLGHTVPLARGGVGQVEAIEGLGSEPLVFKRFHDPALVDEGVLRRFVSWRRGLGGGERARLDRIATWPLSVVCAEGRLAGFVMRRVPEAMTEAVRLPSGAHRRVLREGQYLLAPAEHARRLSVPAVSARVRLGVVWALAEAVAFLHARRMVIGDLSSRNVLWCPESAQVLLVDCDSITLGGVGSPLPPTHTVDWDDPAQPGATAASADVYKLGLFVLRALARSFQARDPAAAGAVLDGSGRLLLGQSLSPDPGLRPSALAWERWAAGRRAARSRPKEHHRHV